MSLPQDFVIATPPPELAAKALSFTRMTNGASTVQVLASAHDYRPPRLVPHVCRTFLQDENERLEVLERSELQIGGLPFCKIITSIKGGLIGWHITGSVDGWDATLTFFYREDEKDTHAPVVQAAVDSITLHPTRAGKPCTDNATRCIDDLHMADCVENKWRVHHCDDLCKDKDGTDGGCLSFEDGTSFCMCKAGTAP